MTQSSYSGWNVYFFRSHMQLSWRVVKLEAGIVLLVVFGYEERCFLEEIETAVKLSFPNRKIQQRIMALQIPPHNMPHGFQMWVVRPLNREANT